MAQGWQPIETAPKDGTKVLAKESYIKPWPQTSRTLYRIFITQFVDGRWIRQNGEAWSPSKCKPI
jgi:hypothetical protein